MAPRRSEPFLQAVAELRRRLSAGELPQDSRLSAAELAAELGLSPTPMREALARLAGEGLLEDRRGEGFFVRRLAARDVADLYRLAQAHLQIAMAAARPPPPGRAPAPLEPGDDPVGAADRLFACWVAMGGSALLVRSYDRVRVQLSGVRRLEPGFLPDLVPEYEGLAAAEASPPKARLARVRAFFDRRLRLAGRLAEALEPSFWSEGRP